MPGMYNSVEARLALIPVLRTANTTVNGVTIDRADTNARVTFVVITGLVTDGTWVFKVQESDDGSSFTDASVTSSEQGASTIVAADDDKVEEIGYKGSKRYCRVAVTSSGATTGALIGAIAILDGGRKPVVRA